jgi:aspartate--ammonia ligase
MVNKVQVKALTDLLETEEAICFTKERFTKRISESLNLARISAPIAVREGTGINDDLNGIEKPVTFSIKGINGQSASIVQSLAKWKRIRLKEYNILPGEGLLTDMRALRPDEELSRIHSIYVDQWDWEKHILPEQRNLGYLKRTVNSIYEAIKATGEDIQQRYPGLGNDLPDKIYFIHAEELLRQYPDLTVKQRETEITRRFGAVFIIGIGANLSNGEPHDGRAPDYDDWSTPNEDGYYGLNGDIVLWNPLLESAFEISSMGIRVNREAMERQIEIRGCHERKNMLFHRMLLNDELPLSIGGGIGQSRLCMLFLKKNHIGQVQSSIWPQDTIAQMNESDIKLL